MNSIRLPMQLTRAFGAILFYVTANVKSVAACDYAVISYQDEVPGYFGCNIGGPGLPVTRIIGTRYDCDTGAFLYSVTQDLVCHNPNNPASVAAMFAAYGPLLAQATSTDATTQVAIPAHLKIAATAMKMYRQA